MSNMVKDWRGEEVPETLPDIPVPHWTCQPDPFGQWDFLAERNYADFLASLKNGLDFILDGYDEDELREGVTITIRLKDIAPADVMDG
jgi:hypothetical protein